MRRCRPINFARKTLIRQSGLVRPEVEDDLAAILLVDEPAELGAEILHLLIFNRADFADARKDLAVALHVQQCVRDVAWRHPPDLVRSMMQMGKAPAPGPLFRVRLRLADDHPVLHAHGTHRHDACASSAGAWPRNDTGT